MKGNIKKRYKSSTSGVGMKEIIERNEKWLHERDGSDCFESFIITSGIFLLLIHLFNSSHILLMSRVLDLSFQILSLQLV